MKRKLAVAALALGVAGGLGMTVQGAASAQDQASMQALADRIALEDMMVRYYAHLGGGDGSSFAAFYVDDSEFEVNGAVYRGRDAIAALYGGLGGGEGGANAETDPEHPRGMSHMLLTNPVIEVHGDTATGSFIWTGFSNADALGAPVVTEQGRDYDLFVRTDAGWRIKKRMIIADGGAPEGMLDTWELKPDYDILADE